MIETINYKGLELVVRSGAWDDVMNSCHYKIVDKIKGYNICVEYSNNVMFALVCY